MTHILSSARPARAAIAAVLAFSATPLIAQDIAPPVIAPTIAPTVPAPAATIGAPAPVMAAPAPVVQAVPSVEERRAAAIAQAEAEAAQQVPAPARAERAQAAPVRERAVVETRAAKPVEAVSASVAATPVTPVVVAPAPVEAAPAPTPVVQVATSGNADALGWGLAGGALLLVGIAGTMAMRRRKLITPADDAVVAQTAYSPAPVSEPQVAMPLMAEQAAATRRQVHIEPHGSLEQMVAASPSAANPFLTRRNRLRRAEFLLRQAEQPVATPQAARVAAPGEPVDRSQMVYRFGADPQARPRWVPAQQ